LLVTVTVFLICVLAEVLLELSHVEVMVRFTDFSSEPIDSFYLVSYMAIVILLRLLRRSTVARPANLIALLVAFLRRPLVAQVTHLKVQLTKLPINVQVFHFHITLHVHARVSSDHDAKLTQLEAL